MEQLILYDYSEQISFFTELVNELKKDNNGLTLTSETISKYCFLTQLFTGFKAEFVNLNQDLRDRYSNYYVDTMPLLLAEDDISFTLYNINFGNIAKLLKDNPPAILGITVKVNFGYEVRFKGLQARDNIESLVVITNNLDVLNKIQDNIEDYFINFVDKILKDYNYQIIMEEYNSTIHPYKMIWHIVTKVLEEKNILFSGNFGSGIMIKNLMTSRNRFFKEHSVLE